MTFRLFLLLMLLVPDLLNAQDRHSLKVDLTAPGQKGAQLAYEFRINPQSSLELSVGFQKHEDQPDWMFHGDQIAHYLQRKLDSLDEGSQVIRTSGWQNVESQPLPDVADHFPLFSTRIRLGWRFVFEKRRSPWRFFLQPGISVSSTRFFEITGERYIEVQYEDKWIIGTYPYQTLVEQESAAYQQTRSMRIKTTWISGITYDIGFARKWGKHFFLEGRLSAGHNFSVPYKSPRPPASLRGLWAQPVVMAGWAF